MKAAGVLKDAAITIVLTGDEERSGSPKEIARADLDAAAGNVRQRDAEGGRVSLILIGTIGGGSFGTASPPSNRLNNCCCLRPRNGRGSGWRVIISRWRSRPTSST